MESKEKIRVSLFLDKNLVETADKIMKERGYRSRNEFYSALLADAIADEVTDKHKEILGEKFAEAMTEYVEEIKRAVSKGLYRYAVHQEIISRMMAEHYGYSYTDVHDMMWKRAKMFADCAVRFRWNRSSPATTQRIKSRLFFQQKKLMKKISKVAGYSKRVVVCCCADKERSAA